MPRTLWLAAVSFMVFTSATTAFGDWEFTKWGMSPNQVIAASKGRAIAMPPDRIVPESTFREATCRAKISGPYTISGVTFNKIFFCFDNSDQLKLITFYSDGAYDFNKLDSALAAAFGAPAKIDNSGLPSRIYNDRAKGNSLKLLNVDPTTILTYRPIPTGF